MGSPGHFWDGDSDVSKSNPFDKFRAGCGVSRYLVWGGREPEKAGCVVVENVALLPGAELVGVLDNGDGIGHQLGPLQSKKTNLTF